jgi:hypothetical protein
MANSPEVPRPNHRTPPQISEVAPADDVRTIMLNQVAWGAVFAGAAIALVMQIILNMIGLGVGLSTLDVAEGDTPSASSMSVGAGVWFVVSGILAAGLGGYIAGRLSGKASSSTTAYHGLISWAVSTLAVVYLLSAAASGVVGGALSTASSALGGAGKALGGSLQTAVQTAAPSLNNVSDPMPAKWFDKDSILRRARQLETVLQVEHALPIDRWVMPTSFINASCLVKMSPYQQVTGSRLGIGIGG